MTSHMEADMCSTDSEERWVGGGGGGGGGVVLTLSLHINK